MRGTIENLGSVQQLKTVLFLPVAGDFIFFHLYLSQQLVLSLKCVCGFVVAQMK